MEAEIIHVQLEAAVVIDANELMNFIHVPGLAERRHSHDFVFALIYFKSEEGGKSAVEKSDGVRKRNFFQTFDLRPFADTQSCGRPFSHAIHCKNRCFIKGRTVKGACGMGGMVVAKKYLRFRHPKTFLDQLFDP